MSDDDKTIDDVVIPISAEAVIDGWQSQIEYHEWKANNLRERLGYLRELQRNPMVTVYGLYNQTTNEYFHFIDTKEGSAVQRGIDIITGVYKNRGKS